MSDRSKIEWTDATWNPLRAENPATGKAGHHCVKISPACAHCYAASMNKRLGTGLDYSSNSPAQTFIDKEALMKPFHWKRPRRIFPCSMTDLFLDSYSDSELDCVFAVMAANPRHTFQVLTKRPERLYAYCEALQQVADDHAPQTKFGTFTPTQVLNLRMLAGSPVPGGILGQAFDAPWPLPNVQFGITAEDQKRFDERVPWLLKTPAAVKFVSCEPLLGSIDLGRHLEIFLGPLGEPDRVNINWVIVGGESGQQARPMHPDWARSLRDQCQAAGVPFFFKQWGEWAEADIIRDYEEKRGTAIDLGDVMMKRVGKKDAGRLLDGREWNEFPQTEAAHA